MTEIKLPPLDLAAIEAAARACTALNFDTAKEDKAEGGSIECPHCNGEGYVELEADYCNFDGKALGVQFYGIGNEHGAAERFLRAANPAVVLELIRIARAAIALNTTPPAAEAVASYHAWCGSISDEATLRRAISVMEDVLGDISGWEDTALAEAVTESKTDLIALADVISTFATPTGMEAPAAEPVAGDAALLARIEALEVELDAKQAELDEALHDAPWPEWAKQVLKMTRDLSGYDGYDDSDGIDIAEEVREAYAELTAQIERLRAAPPTGEVKTEADELAEWLKDGETVLERLKREQKDMLSAMELLAGERRLVEQLRAQIAGELKPAPALSDEREALLLKAVQEAYGWLWHINNEPMAPVPLLSPEQASYEARKSLRDLLTMAQRGEAINAVHGLLENKATIQAALAAQEQS